MLSKTDIEKSLNRIVSLYDKANDSFDKVLYSKLAIIELSGWIEWAIDEIVTDHIRRSAKKHSNINDEFICKKVLKKVNGFNYNQHDNLQARQLLIDALGVSGVAELESKILEVKNGSLSGHLDTLTQLRNDCAHLHIGRSTKRYDSPDQTRSKFSKIYKILKEMENHLRIAK